MSKLEKRKNEIRGKSGLNKKKEILKKVLKRNKCWKSGTNKK